MPGESNGPTGREWGELTKEVYEIRHDLRGIRLVVDSHNECLHELELQIGSITTKIYTTFSVVTVFAGVVAFFISTFGSTLVPSP